MSKSKRIENRVNRLEKRFRKQIAKGKKGTDWDIELHERRIKRLKSKSPLNFTIIPGFGNQRGIGNFFQNPIRQGIFGSPIGKGQAFQPLSYAQQDPNNASATGFVNTDPHNMMMNPELAQVATGAPGSDSGNFSDGSLGYRVNKFGGFAGPTGGGKVPVNVATENNFTDQYSFRNASSVPITTGGMSNQSQGVANNMFGDTLTRQRIMNPNTMVDQRQNNLRPNQLLEPQSLIN